MAINDIADVHTLVHLFKYDSTHGRFNGKVDITIENEKIYLNIQSNQRLLKVEVLQQKAGTFTVGKFKIDVVLECTGLFRSHADATRHLEAG